MRHGVQYTSCRHEGCVVGTTSLRGTRHSSDQRPPNRALPVVWCVRPFMGCVINGWVLRTPNIPVVCRKKGPNRVLVCGRWGIVLSESRNLRQNCSVIHTRFQERPGTLRDKQMGHSSAGVVTQHARVIWWSHQKHIPTTRYIFFQIPREFLSRMARNVRLKYCI